MTKIQAASASEICSRFTIDPSALPLLRNDMGPREFIEALARNKKYVAGIDFLAHALPPRESIWWGCLCFQHVSGDAMNEVEKNACRAAVEWVLRPGEENRAAARIPSEIASAGTAAGALAAAAHQTGGNVAPPGAPATAPAPYAPAKSVAIAIKLAAIKADPARILETQRIYFDLGVGVAEGRYI